MSGKSPKISECSTATDNGFSTVSKSSSSIASTFDMAKVGRQFANYFNYLLTPGPVKKRKKSSKILKKPKKTVHVQKWVFSCRGCGKPITERDVRNENAVYALESTWHRSHLVCFKCGSGIGEEQRPFLNAAKGSDKPVPVCLDCHMSEEHDKCTVCDKRLFESCLQVNDVKMHKTCFICEKCKAPVPDGKYALINDKPYDIDCYFLKKYEPCLTSQFQSMELPQSPPPVATMSDSSTTVSTMSTDTDLASFKRKNTECISLTEFAGLEEVTRNKTESSDRTRSAEGLDVDVVLPKPGFSSEIGILLGPNATSKEKMSREKSSSREKMPGSSKEKLITSKEGIPVPRLSGSKEALGESLPTRKRKEDEEKFTPVREKLEDFVNMEEDMKKASKIDSKETSSPGSGLTTTSGVKPPQTPPAAASPAATASEKPPVVTPAVLDPQKPPEGDPKTTTAPVNANVESQQKGP